MWATTPLFENTFPEAGQDDQYFGSPLCLRPIETVAFLLKPFKELDCDAD
jgi:hypothetical protein